MSALNLISPYRHAGTWVFDDARVGLHQEPFISGADTMIDLLVADIPGADKGFRLLFSATPFPGSATKLEWLREDRGGSWYYSRDFKMEGWLCPALAEVNQRIERNRRSPMDSTIETQRHAIERLRDRLDAFRRGEQDFEVPEMQVKRLAGTIRLSPSKPKR
jgi:hypothetical protein